MFTFNRNYKRGTMWALASLLTDRSNLFALLAMTCSTINVSAADKVLGVKFYTTNTYKYQKIDGFGGCGMSGQWVDVYSGNQAKVNMLWGQGDNQIGLNIMRIRINPIESNWGQYGNPIKYARLVCPDLQVFATPWTPPKKYKTGPATTPTKNEFGTYVYPIVPSKWDNVSSAGGTIIDDSIPSYANFLERYRATMEKKGCPIDIISIQNECDYTPTDGGTSATYESCIYSPNQMAKMAKAARAAIDPKCKVMGPETFGYGQAKYNTTLAAIDDAKNNIDLWGNHQYGSNDYSFIKSVQNTTGKHMWMTEYLINYSDDYTSDFPGETYDGKFKWEYKMIEKITKELQNGINGYVYYNMNDDFFASAHGGDANTLGKRAWVFGHYAKYATGKTRVQPAFTNSTYAATFSPYATAFLSDSGDTLSFFILNPTTEDYTINLTPPFEPTKVKMVVTNDVVNRKVFDITDKYVASSKTVSATLYAGSFYTFVFEKNDTPEPVKPMTIASSCKKESNVNPICPINYIADPTGIEYNGRLYVYGTNDQQQYDNCEGLVTNNYSKITQLVCLSTADFANWTFHGTIDVKAAAPWIYTSWAPSIVRRKDSEGKEHFYMYFTNGAAGIGVLTADNPLGPWKDPLGKALVNGSTPGIGVMSNIIDPGVVVDTLNNRAYMAFGGGGLHENDTTSTSMYPGNARIVELGEDMISLKGDIVSVKAPYHFEANELNIINKKIAFSYCSRWNDPAGAASMRWMMADSIKGTWAPKGIYFQNPGMSGYPFGNNHTHWQKFGNTNYLIYHTQYMENANGINAGYRNLAIDRLSINETKRQITTLTPTDAGPSTISTSLPVMGTEVQAETFGNAAGIRCDNDATKPGNCFVTSSTAGSWTELRSASFPAATLGNNIKFSAKLQGTGTLEVRLDAIDSTAVATIDFDNATVQEVSADITKTLSAINAKTIKHNVFLVFTKIQSADSGQANDVKFDSWSITAGKEALRGDVNGDGKVDDKDIADIITVISGGTITGNADVNNDKSVDVLDINCVISEICK